MELVKSKWQKQDIQEFLKYLESIANVDKSKWTKAIYNTNMKCLAIKVPILRKIAVEISKGNFLSFVDYFLDDYYENVAINGFLIQKIQDFDTFKRYLLKYIDYVDCWASCDLLIFKKLKFDKNQLFQLAKELILDDRLFARRIGVLICFAFIDSDIDKVFEIIVQLKNEKEYYVNMCVSWLMCECFIKRKCETLKFLHNSNNNINAFTINKFVSKCRDSYRVSKEDKDMLLNFKRC